MTDRMNQRERELWQMINIKGYAAMSCVIDSKLQWIVRDITTRPEKLSDHYRVIREEATRFVARIELIDLSQLDARFPLVILTRLKEEALPFLQELLLLVDRFEFGHCEPDEIIRLVAHERATTCTLLFQLSREMLEVEGYHRYRRHFELPRY